MAAETLHVRLSCGDVVIDLDGDAASVTAQVAAWTASGFGHLLDFFATAGPGAAGIGVGGSVAGGGIGGSVAGGSAALTPIADPARTLSFVVESFTPPGSPGEYAHDFDGSGHAVNGLGGIVAAFAAIGLDLRTIGGAEAGAPAVLLRVVTEDHDLTMNQRVDVTLTAGIAVGPGLDLYVVSPAQVPVTVCGTLTGGVFVSQDPLDGGAFAAVRLPLPMFPGQPAISIVLNAVQIGFRLGADGTTLADGWLAGAADGSNIAAVMDAVAAKCTAFLARNRGTATAQQLVTLFDTGGCRNPDGSVAAAGDGIISPCELMSSPMLAAVTAPDIAMFDGSGRYRPGAGAKTVMAMGCGFTASAAAF